MIGLRLMHGSLGLMILFIQTSRPSCHIPGARFKPFLFTLVERRRR
jgi:hypothetical protein